MRLRTALLLAAMLLALATAAQAAPTVYTTPGERFRVTLDANITTGYTWQVAGSPRGIRLVSKNYVQEAAKPGMVGVGGREVLLFESTRVGSVRLELRYARPWDKKATGTTYALNVSCNPRTSATKTSTEAIYTHVDRRFGISQAANRTTGHDWKLANKPDAGVVMLLGSEYQASKPVRPGSGGHRKFRYRAVGVGHATILLEYRRLSGPATQAAKAHAVVVTVVK